MKKNDKLVQIIDFMHEAGHLKTTYRFGANAIFDGDSSADHSWRLALLSFILAEETNLEIDGYKALKIALVHDLAEALTGDIDARLIDSKAISKDTKRKQEKNAIKKLIKNLPEKSGRQIESLWNEYGAAKTPEAKYIKALDKMETQIKVLEEGYEKYDTPDLIGLYGKKEVGKFRDLEQFYFLIKSKLKKEYKKGGLPWKKEYEQLI